MTINSTELEQREKFEAWLSEKPPYARYMHWCDSLNAYDYTGIQLAWEAYQAGGDELVEALEKAQQTINEMDGRTIIVKMPHRNLGHPKLFLLCPFPYYDAEDMEKALAAAGIKVEAE